MSSQINDNTYNTVLSKGLQANLPNTIADCKLRFTTDTKRLYIDANTERIQITDAIYDYTEAQIRALVTYLPKLYVASDTGVLFVSNGSTIKEVVFSPVAVTDNNAYYITISNSTTKNGYNTGLSFNPSTKAMTIGNIQITQESETDEDENVLETVHFSIL